MKIKELILESITFSPAKVIVEPNGEKYISHTEFDERYDELCSPCDGTGKIEDEDRSYPCPYCNQKGRYTAYRKKEGVPELNLSNSNGYDLLEWLGLESDYSGFIPPEQIDSLYSQLMRIKNNPTDQENFTTQTSQSSRTFVDKSDPSMPTIRTGPTMINVGRSAQQVERYINHFLDLVVFARKNNTGIGWS